MRDVKLVLGFLAVAIGGTAWPLLAYVALMELLAL